MVVTVPTHVGMLAMPPVFNIRWFSPPVLVWVAVIGLMQWLWVKQHDLESGSLPVDWMFVATKDLHVPVLLAGMLENAPSVVLCPFDTQHSLSRLASETVELVKSMAGIDTIMRSDVMERAEALSPLRPQAPPVPDDSEDSDPETGVRLSQATP